MALEAFNNRLLTLDGVSSSIRGTGKACFVFAKSATRAVEVSLDGSTLWIEFWGNADEESDDAPVKEIHFEEAESAFASVKAWLGGSI
jgi:hypothetical protein